MFVIVDGDHPAPESEVRFFKMCILDLDGNRQFQLYCFQNGKL